MDQLRDCWSGSVLTLAWLPASEREPRVCGHRLDLKPPNPWWVDGEPALTAAMFRWALVALSAILARLSSTDSLCVASKLSSDRLVMKVIAKSVITEEVATNAESTPTDWAEWRPDRPCWNRTSSAAGQCPCWADTRRIQSKADPCLSGRGET